MPDTPDTSKKQPTPLDRNNDSEFAADFCKAMLPLKTCGKRWKFYASGVWTEQPRDHYRPLLLNGVLPPKKRTASRERAIMDLVEGLHQTPETCFRGAYYQEGDTVHFNLLNGVIAVTPTSIKLRDHSEHDYFTRCFAVDYRPTATCPIYMKVLHEALPDEADRNLFQLCLGNFLLPDARFETVLVCYGNAGCSKSTLAEPVGSLFGGGDNGLMTNLSMAQICDSKGYWAAKLRYANVNLASELQGQEIEDSSILKQLVSGESFEAREIYAAPFNMQTACKLWFLTNNMPRFNNGTHAEIRRMRFIRFDQVPIDKDANLKQKLRTELPGLFNYMLAGLQRLVTLNSMPQGGAASQHTAARFSDTNDPIGMFMETCCKLDSAGTASKKVLKAAFSEFVETRNYSVKVNDVFFRRLYDRFPSINESRPLVDGVRVRVINGVTLNADVKLMAEEDAIIEN